MFIRCSSLNGADRYIMIDKIVCWQSYIRYETEYTSIQMTQGCDIEVKNSPEEVANKISKSTLIVLPVGVE